MDNRIFERNPEVPMKRLVQSDPITRRSFLKTTGAAGAAAAFPAFVPSPVLGNRTPGDRIAVGCIGVGRMGMGDLRGILGFDEVRVVAVCDVDAHRLEHAKKTVDAAYARHNRSGTSRGCDGYRDFRELVARPDIDAVMVCTPDHWHALPAIAAAKAGKDVFLQKPLTYTIEEGRVLRETVQRYGTVFITGSQQRSASNFRFACELVRNGRIGELRAVQAGCGMDPGTTVQPVMPVPEHLDYDFWLGPAPWAPYTEKRVHPRTGYGRPGFLRVSDYCLGMVTGWGAHHMDIAHWGLGMEHSGPVAIEAEATFPEDGLWDVHNEYRIDYTYANGVHVIFSDNKRNKQGVLFEGSEGWVYVRRGAIDAHPKSLLSSVIGPDEIHLYKSNNHKGNWLECIRNRSKTVAPVEIGHRSCSVCILGYIAMKLGRRLTWNPEREGFEGDDEANRLLARPMRAPWRL
jgi:predicted dehydrogenase